MGTDRVLVAEKRDRLVKLQRTLRSKGGNLERVAEHMDLLWEHPDYFEDGDLTDTWRDDHLLMVFEMGVLFGLDYEHAYPAGERENWPMSVKDRPRREDL